MTNLDQLLGLHEEIIITYCVDHFEAQFVIGDGTKTIMTGSGQTIQEAMTDLEVMARIGQDAKCRFCEEKLEKTNG